MGAIISGPRIFRNIWLTDALIRAPASRQEANQGEGISSTAEVKIRNGCYQWMYRNCFKDFAGQRLGVFASSGTKLPGGLSDCGRDRE
jgi:hypothetical protein